MSIASAGSPEFPVSAAVPPEPAGNPGAVVSPSGIEGQRMADMGDGRYVNPILAGDRPDPSVLKDGADYYMVHSSFDYTPGLVIWHSGDLVNWEPIGPALRKNVGKVWAPDLAKVGGRYYIYLPVITDSGVENMVVFADDIRGPWSDPINLHVGHIDPGHAVSEDGKRYLFLNEGMMVGLSDDGLGVTGSPRKVYEGWKYPEEWDVETFAQEGPKILRRGDYFYMVVAEGGTAGPPTSHMVVMARSGSLEGPWENSPYNPVVRTRSAEEKWWSRGHATLVEGPDGEQWYLVYHAYENGYYNLGRQTLLEPVEWTRDGWVKAMVDDVAQPIAMPPGGGTPVPHGAAFSDDFSTDRIGTQWQFYRADTGAPDRYRYGDRSLILKASGTSPKDCSPLTLAGCGDPAYELQVEVDCDEGAAAGLLVFYSDRLFAGHGFSGDRMLEYSKGDTNAFSKPAQIGRRFFLRLRNNRHIVTVWYSPDGENWTRHWMQYEVSGYHHNVAGEFLSLRPSLAKSESPRTLAPPVQLAL